MSGSHKSGADLPEGRGGPDDMPRRAPSLDEIERIARMAFDDIPQSLRRHVGDVVLRVSEFPDGEVCEEMALESPFDLLGLYRGVSLDQRSSFDLPTEPDVIDLYRRPILDYWCETDDDLETIVRHVLIHEIGHHFGFSDDDMEAIEDGGMS